MPQYLLLSLSGGEGSNGNAVVVVIIIRRHHIIPPIATVGSVYMSVCLSQSCTLLKPLDGMRCRGRDTRVAPSNIVLDGGTSFTGKFEGRNSCLL